MFYCIPFLVKKYNFNGEWSLVVFIFVVLYVDHNFEYSPTHLCPIAVFTHTCTVVSDILLPHPIVCWLKQINNRLSTTTVWYFQLLASIKRYWFNRKLTTECGYTLLIHVGWWSLAVISLILDGLYECLRCLGERDGCDFALITHLSLPPDVVLLTKFDTIND